METQSRLRLGFVGLGLMGQAMALRLRERGWPLAVWNREPERIPAVTEAGATPCATPADVARHADVVLLCVLDAAALEDVCFGPDGLTAGLARGAIVLDHSTADPAKTRDIAERVQHAAGASWIDAPVSGGPGPARAGSLTIMAGGETRDLARVAPVLADLGANVTQVGTLGAGQTVKNLNQAITGVSYVLMAEVLAMAEAAGVDAARVPAALAGGFADSQMLQRAFPMMQQRAFEPPTSYARQMLKDLKNVRTFAEGLGLSLPLIDTALQQFQRYVGAGNEMRETASISRMYDPAKVR